MNINHKDLGSKHKKLIYLQSCGRSTLRDIHQGPVLQNSQLSLLDPKLRNPQVVPQSQIFLLFFIIKCCVSVVPRNYVKRQIRSIVHAKDFIMFFSFLFLNGICFHYHLHDMKHKKGKVLTITLTFHFWWIIRLIRWSHPTLIQCTCSSLLCS